MNKHYLVIEEITQRDLETELNNAYEAGYCIVPGGIMPAQTIEGDPFGGWVIMHHVNEGVQAAFEPPKAIQTPVATSPATNVEAVLLDLMSLTEAQRRDLVKKMSEETLDALWMTIEDKVFGDSDDALLNDNLLPDRADDLS